MTDPPPPRKNPRLVRLSPERTAPPSAPGSPSVDVDSARSGWLPPAGLVGGLVALGYFAGVGWVIVICALVTMIFMHELGHYLTARWAGMKVTEFFIGFGPRIWSFRMGATTYGIKALWLGAYVRIIGMNSLDEVPPSEEASSFRHQSYPKRLLVLVAGPAMHFLMALAVIFVVLIIDDRAFNHTVAAESHDSWTLATVSVDSAASEAGLEPGDELVSVNGETLSTFDELGPLVSGLAGEEVPVVYRRDGVTRTTTATVGERLTAEGAAGIAGLIAYDRILAVESLDTDGPPSYEELAIFARRQPGQPLDIVFLDARTGAPGLVEDAVISELIDPRVATTGFFGVSARYQPRGLGASEAFGASLRLVTTIVTDIAATIPRSLTEGFDGAFDWLGEDGPARVGAVDARELETRRLDPGITDEYRIISIYGVARLGVSATENGLVEALEMSVLVNIVLGLFNLLPLLPLDGGQVAVATYERIRSIGGRRYRVDAAKLLPFTYVVVVVLLVITSMALIRDIVDPINFG